MRKIAVVLMNRANYGRAKTVMEAIQAHRELSLSVIAGGSGILKRFGDLPVIMKNEGFKPSVELLTVVEGDRLAAMPKSTGLSMIELASVFDRESPDMVLAVADRFETLATAATASYMNIPLAHTQGGEVSGSIDEKVRHAVTKLADLHFPATERAKDFIIRMGEDSERVHLTGCPSIDLAKKADLTLPEGFFSSRGGVGHEIDASQPYVVVSQHAVTSEFVEAGRDISQTLEAIDRILSSRLQVVWLWPNIDLGSERVSNRVRDFRERHRSGRIRFYKNFSPEDYLKLIKNSHCLVGNSSSGIRESAYLGIPVVNIGSRQRYRERGPNVIDVSNDAAEIEAAVYRQIEHGEYEQSLIFGSGDSGQRIAKVIASSELKIEKSLSYL